MSTFCMNWTKTGKSQKQGVIDALKKYITIKITDKKGTLYRFPFSYNYCLGSALGKLSTISFPFTIYENV